MPRKKKNISVLECFDCGRQFGRKLFNLKRHLLLHDEKLKCVKCSLCQRVYQNTANYKAHFIKKHGQTITKPDFVECVTEPKKNCRSCIKNGQKSEFYFNIGKLYTHYIRIVITFDQKFNIYSSRI